MRLTPGTLALAAAVNVRRRAGPLEPRCGCEIRVVDYRVCVAVLSDDSPEREALLDRARTERCPQCHRLRYGGGLMVEPVDWITSEQPVPVIVQRAEDAP